LISYQITNFNWKSFEWHDFGKQIPTINAGFWRRTSAFRLLDTPHHEDDCYENAPFDSCSYWDVPVNLWPQLIKYQLNIN
jgi:hypothetical protein